MVLSLIPLLYARQVRLFEVLRRPEDPAVGGSPSIKLNRNFKRLDMPPRALVTVLYSTYCIW